MDNDIQFNQCIRKDDEGMSVVIEFSEKYSYNGNAIMEESKDILKNILYEYLERNINKTKEENNE